MPRVDKKEEMDGCQQAELMQKSAATSAIE
jgi:hypothetical protein